MNRDGLRARIRRLEKLIAGLGMEETLWRTCSLPALALERQEYMDAIYGAIQSLETARMALVKITHWLEKEGAGRIASLG
jgi:hypothetical protein